MPTGNVEQDVARKASKTKSRICSYSSAAALQF